MNDKETLNNLAETAFKKQALSKTKPVTFFFRAFLAGIFIAIGIILSYSAGALLFSVNAGVARLINALTMSIALILIIFIGGELFTGMNFVMAVGFYEKKYSLRSVIRVWLFCWFGNFAACLIFGILFALSGANGEALSVYMTETVTSKLDLSWYVLIVRGMFANFCVCCAVLACFKLKTETGKLIIIIFCVFAFIVSGFEHSIANMGIFTIASFYVENFNFISALKNLLFSSIGNIIGGAVMLGLPYWAVSKNE